MYVSKSKTIYNVFKVAGWFSFTKSFDRNIIGLELFNRYPLLFIILNCICRCFLRLVNIPGKQTCDGVIGIRINVVYYQARNCNKYWVRSCCHRWRINIFNEDSTKKIVEKFRRNNIFITYIIAGRSLQDFLQYDDSFDLVFTINKSKGFPQWDELFD